MPLVSLLPCAMISGAWLQVALALSFEIFEERPLQPSTVAKDPIV